MLSDNKYRIKGRFKANPDLRENENGTKYTMFTLAVKKYSLKNGKIDYNTCIFLDFKAWSGLAERICREGKKGDRVWVEGEIDSYLKELPDGTSMNVQIQLVQDFEILKPSVNNGDDLKDIPNNNGEPYFSPPEFDDYRPPFDIS